MIESLNDLDSVLKSKKSKIHYFYGENVKVIEEICRKIKVGAVVSNKDYTPYARKRDKQIGKWCEGKGIEFDLVEDYLLAPMGTFVKGNTEPYKVYSPFRDMVFNNEKYIEKPKSFTSKMNIEVVRSEKIGSKSLKEIPNIYSREGVEETEVDIKGGREEGMKKLKGLKGFKKYNTERNMTSKSTTRLSAYIKFGCVSIREVYWIMRKKLGSGNELLAQLVWREFYYYIGYFNPEVLKGENLNKKFDYLNGRWLNKSGELKKWKEGKTGYPIVDAGMRELNHTGYMHNRSRLITSNFMNRLLGQDWRNGEKYFANRLTDYDPLVNNGNWQWIASTGVDTKPYQQRVFNPWAQSEKYDVDAEYIYKWVPELKGVLPEHIHKWYKYYDDERYSDVNYMKPMVNYEERREMSLNMYKK